MRTRLLRLTSVLLLLTAAGCATQAIDEAERLSRGGQYEQALAKLDAALRDEPDDPALRTAQAQQRERVLVQATSHAELALSAGRLEEAQRLLERVQAVAPQHPRSAALAQAVARQRARAQGAALAAAVAASAPSSAPPRASTAPTSAAPLLLGAAFQRPVSLEFRDAPLRQVFEALARSSGVNFVFDKDVRADARITVFLRAVTLDEAMRVILATQQLDRKLLNEHTVLVYPNTAPKQREHQELVTRSLFLTNIDAKQALALVRTMAKTRDLHVEERINALVVRDTLEVVNMVEQLLATLDVPEPEVTLAVEVMEVATDRLDELGIDWPSTVQFGVPGVVGLVPLSSGDFRGLVASPALVATLRGTAGSNNLLANPTIRARNREKAKVQIGERLPIFTTTSAVNVGVSSSVSYLDVGLKLDIEPSVQLDGDVVIKVALEVSNLLREVRGPSGSLAYQVGTRLTTTSLRLKDGETQVLAGLITDEDRSSATGVPGLSRLPVLGRLFGVRSDTRNKTEIVMLITPRIVRNVHTPLVGAATLASGTDSLPGATALRLRPAARVGIAAGAGGVAVGRPASASPSAPASTPAARAEASPPATADVPATAGAAAIPTPPTEPPPELAALVLSSAAEARPGDTVAVTLANRSGQRAGGELLYDATLAQIANSAGAATVPGRWAFDLAPQAEAVLVLRVLPAAAGRSVLVQASAAVPVAGSAEIRVRP